MWGASLDEILLGGVADKMEHQEPVEQNPLVSVMMAVYWGDTSDNVDRALRSIVQQDYPFLEVILILDGPVCQDVLTVIDDIQKHNDVEFFVIQLEENQGLGPALNRAILEAKGDFLARMDADDCSLQGRIRTQVRYLIENSKVDVVGCCMEEVFEDGRSQITSVPLTHDDCVQEFCRRDPLHHPTTVFRRRFFQKAGLYPPEFCEDNALWLAGMKAGCQFANLNEPMYRMYLNHIFFSRRRELRWVLPVFRYRLHIVREMGYGLRGYIWAFMRLIVMLQPAWVLKQAYQIRNVVWRLI